MIQNQGYNYSNTKNEDKHINMNLQQKLVPLQVASERKTRSAEMENLKKEMEERRNYEEDLKNGVSGLVVESTFESPAFFRLS